MSQSNITGHTRAIDSQRDMVIGLKRTYGEVLIRFPMGEMTFRIRNESELDRAVEMMRHMLKEHEIITATDKMRAD